MGCCFRTPAMFDIEDGKVQVATIEWRMGRSDRYKTLA